MKTDQPHPIKRNFRTLNHKIVSGIILIAVSILISNRLYSQVPNYIPTNGLLAWYPFTGNANDQWINAHNGLVNGATLTTDRFNSAASAYSYNGINNYISIPDNSGNFRPQNLTISTWVLFNTIPYAHRMILAKNIAGNGYVESIDINYAGNLNSWFCNIGSPSMNSPYLTYNYPISTGTWYNLIYQFDDLNNVQKIYVNGVFTASLAVNMSIGYDSQPWTIGTEYEYGSLFYFFNGKIDDIGIWDRILSPCEINQVYTASFSPLSINVSSVTICQGGQANLVATGANSYTWNPGGIVGSNISVGPNVNTTYSVSGTNNLGCIGTTTAIVIVNNNPILNITSSAEIVCAGTPVYFTANGANTYTWNTLSNNISISVSPTTNTTYTVSGTDLNGCVGSTSIFQIVSVCTQIENYENINEIKIHACPNPYRDKLTIDIDSNNAATLLEHENITVQVINVLGKVVYSRPFEANSNHFELDTKELPEGVYFVNVISGAYNKSIRVIKD